MHNIGFLIFSNSFWLIVDTCTQFFPLAENIKSLLRWNEHVTTPTLTGRRNNLQRFSNCTHLLGKKLLLIIFFLAGSCFSYKFVVMIRMVALKMGK